MARPDNYGQLRLELSDAEDQQLPSSESERTWAQLHCDEWCPEIDIIIPLEAMVIEGGSGVWIQGWIWLDDNVRDEP